MDYAELSPRELLSLEFAAPAVTERAWHVGWDAGDGVPERLAAELLPPVIDFRTSGSTGESRLWRRLRENVWREAGMLADMVAPEKPEAVVSCVPPAHLFGALASVLVPAHLRVPVWHKPTFYGAMPPIEQRRVVVVATPWIFTLLLQHLAWVREMEHVTVLYGGAMIPETAGEFLAEAGPDRALIVEMLGSTEAGGIATRRWREGEPPPWTLFPDVSFAASGEPDDDGEVPLVINSPRLAFAPGERAPSVWEADDRVRPLDERRFHFAGRRSRLVKVNGRRINLDEVENALRGVLDCADLAVLPVADRMIGEHVDLLVVLKPGGALADLDLAAAFERMGVRPRRVHTVPRIERSALGKVRHLSTPPTSEAEEAQ
ncbi:AMP-binding protein [Herbidospora yilanensis]|uniref:AMP-binding protein n=1 Tax=Herbidospora yilanensis TaxID=354426 RepID=UPI000780F6FF|nr:class I adenylate-forming enzyme family protein [Herbidospora yilanensis]